MDSLFNNFEKLNILIIGDLMLDIYISGKVDRISAEAPVPILDIKNKEYRLGGAANVAANIKAMGATPYICSVIGDDKEAVYFRDLIKKNGLSDNYIISSSKLKTTTKTRFLSQFQQVLRVDDEISDPIDSEETKKLINAIDKLLMHKKIDAIIFQDYDKGIITTKLIKNIVDKANKKNIPIAVDPKFRNFHNYKNITLFKPNFKEFCNGLKINLDADNIQDLTIQAETFRQKINTDIIMITLAEKGMYIKNVNSCYLIPTYAKSVYDVSGAGDTVISIATLALSIGLDINKIAMLSNLSGGIVCEAMGVVPINKSKLMEKAKDLITS